MSERLLEIDNVSLAFGGLMSVSGLDLYVDEGEIVSVIGPNGAGKTTLFNLITGIYDPDEGDIRLAGQSIVGMQPHQITRLGIARTFQTLRLFLNMTVKDNVMAAAYGHTRAGIFRSMIRTPGMRREEREISELAEQKLAFFGQRLMGYRWNQPAYSLSYANRRRLEIARATATNPRLLLLDEPAAGMNPVETHEITELIGQLRTEGGYTILVIEHDMHVVEGISDRVVALDHGVKIAEGSFGEVATDPLVVEAYLGLGTTETEVTTADAPLLELDNVDTYYGQIHILQGLTLHIEPGELVCLLGGNASGKSTTLKTILGIVRPRNGTVRVERRGRDAPADELPDRARPGDRAGEPPPVRADDGAREPRARRIPAGRRRQGGLRARLRAVPAAARAGSQLAGTLSGGEQQMVAMGRALMSRPKLLLMDEPSMGLAPILVERNFEIIKQVHESGVAILVVEQNANVSLSIADRGYVLSTGRLVLEGPAADLRENEELRKAYLGR